ncbi:unnamed protein product [Vitrella brassicaformis CCMP3155]|uniref:Uncharacterized protein n=1 Tax=Vitrella brassicaformis (strain CCMP3155) TaxID=1169540 RepID=A0A0G4FQL8_VITBC|nr:unnamed protein product [Vitrella brassicaformis CCMP3155]|eukprot:CEM16745.1 unnamed protein product [Vitrella brassicaformis CCMP3155]
MMVVRTAEEERLRRVVRAGVYGRMAVLLGPLAYAEGPHKGQASRDSFSPRRLHVLEGVTLDDPPFASAAHSSTVEDQTSDGGVFGGPFTVIVARCRHHTR